MILLISLSTAGQLAVSGLVVGCIYALVALGFNVIFNATDILNFAQGEFLLLGGFAFYTGTITLHLPLITGALFSIAVVAIVGAITQLVVVRFARGEGLMGAGAALIGVSFLAVAIMSWIWGVNPLPVREFTPGKPFFVGQVAITRQQVWIVAITILVIICFHLFFQRTNIGIAMRAASLNPSAARGVGISVERMALWAFVLGSALAAIGGILITPTTGVLASGGFVLTLKGFTAAILGGIGNPIGAIVGGLALGLIESLSVGFISSGYQQAVPMLLLILILMVRPGGILGVGLSARA